MRENIPEFLWNLLTEQYGEELAEKITDGYVAERAVTLRVNRLKATPEEMERVNQYNREKTARRKLREHFDVHDYFTDLTYKRDERPEDMIAAKDDFKKFIREVRKKYKKHGYVLKWMRNIEVGTKNGWHIHLIINRYPETDEILAEAWKMGKVIKQLMYKTGEFA